MESASSPIRVVLGVGHEMMRRSLLLLLEEEDGIRVVAEADDLQAMLDCLQRDRPQVLVFDHRLPDGPRRETIRMLREHAPDTQVVLLTMDDHHLFAESAFDAGALGFVLKDHADSDLLPAIQAAAHGKPYASPWLKQSGRSSGA